MLTKLTKLIFNIIPENIAYSVTRFLASLPQKASLTRQDKEFLLHAKRIEFGSSNNSKIAWSWGEGPIVILVHGWGGCGAHMGGMATQIARKGFQAIAIDITAHGSSSGKRISFRMFSQDLAALVRSLDQSIYAYVGHSAGGLCMMAARELEGLHAKKYVCISAPKTAYPPIKLIIKKLGVSESVIHRYKVFLANQFNCQWEDITQRAFASDSQAELLLIYDAADRFVNHTDGDQIKLFWPTATLVKTQGNKHAKQISSPEIQEKVVGFLVESE